MILTELFDKYKSDKGTFGDAHNYAIDYETLVPRSTKRLLEIGIGTHLNFNGSCGSILAWLDWIEGEVIGFDCEEPTVGISRDRFTYVKGDQGVREDVERLSRIAGKCDAIIDDGSHLSQHQRLCLEVLWDNVAEGGVYVIEDVHFKLGEQPHLIDYLPGDARFEKLIGNGRAIVLRKAVSSRRAIISFAHGDQWSAVSEQTWPRMKSYAAKHNASFLCGDMIRSNARPRSWMKLAYIAEMLVSHDEVLWLDADVLIEDDSVSIFDEFPAGENHHAMRLLVDSESNRHFNCGVWICRRGAIPMIVLAAMEDDVIHHKWWEQAAVERHLGEFPPFSLGECWNHWLGSPDSVTARFRHACFQRSAGEKAAQIETWIRSEA